MSRRRVVVTGLGVVSPVGLTWKSFWQALLKGQNGVGDITLFDTTGFETKIAAEVRDFSVDDFVDRREARRMDRFTHFAIAAAQMAVEDSQIEFDKEDLNRIGVIASSGIGGMQTFERECRNLINKGPKRISPFFIPMMISDIAPGHISIRYGLKGPNFSTISACASSSHSLGEAFKTIQRGDADVMLAGGSEATITPMGIAGFNTMRALSTRNNDPQHASRPFDLERDGFVVGEGGAIIVLEELEHAIARGAHIYAEMVGYAATADAYHITAPVPGGGGAARAMTEALADGGLKPEEVVYVNAHGTSTQFNDKTETEAIKTTFGEYAQDLSISSTKSMIGHLLGASGAVEFVATVASISHDQIHPTINQIVPDPDCDLNYTPNKTISKVVKVAISNSFGFGGHNVCLALRKYS
jgi:3-oxoacyl-[acyl-carrier-protein] synthase II